MAQNAASPLGNPAASAPAGRTFAALLPGLVTPVMPRQADAEGGKQLPASVTDDDEDGKADASATAWVTPPSWPAVCPPVETITAEVAVGATVPEATPTVPFDGGTLLGDREVSPLIAPALVDEAAAPTGSMTPAVGKPVMPIVPGEGTAAAGGGVPVSSPARPPVVPPISPLVQPAIIGDTPLTPATTPPPRPGTGGATVSSAIPAPIAPAVLPIGGDDVALGGAPSVPILASAGSVAANGIVSAAGAVAVEVPARSGQATPAEPATKDAVPVMPTADLQPLQLARIAPASQMFAAAIQRAARDERLPSATDALQGLVAATADLTVRGVTAAESASHAALDMARDTWPSKMIERIELLRDAADAVDTNIRLVPDKLGAIDVSLRRDGDHVRVQLDAHQPETRQLLADAQSTLVEMAEAKGVRLSMQTGDGSGAGQQPHQRAAAPAPAHLSRRAAADPSATGADVERIA